MDWILDETRDTADILDELMAKHRLTAYELSNRIGVSRATVGSWIKTRHVPHPRMLRAALVMIELGKM